MCAMNRTFLIYDSAALQNESDDPLLAVKYFVSPQPIDNGRKCVLCGSLVTLYDSMKMITGSPPRKVTLQNEAFAVARAKGEVTVALGSTLESDCDPGPSLDLCIEIVRFRFFSFPAMLRLWEAGKINDDILTILARTEKLSNIENDFEIQMRCSLFMDNCQHSQWNLGSCVLFGEKIVNSHFDQKGTQLIFAASYFPNHDSTSVKTEVSSLTWFTVYLTPEHFREIGSKCITKDPVKMSCEDSAGPLSFTLACLCVNQTAMLILCDASEYDSEVTQRLEKELASLDKQMAGKFLVEEDSYIYL